MKKSPKKLIISYLFFCIIFTTAVASLILLSQFLLTKADALSTEISKPQAFSTTVIIDAGHGGEDGGAIGTNGIYEKDLNLKIATELADMLRASGINVIMTRNEDILLYDRNVDFKGRKKMLDLAARLKVANETENAVFISIHMNSFPIEKYSGLQVYYSKNTPESKMIAQNIQSSVKDLIQSNNGRSVKEADEKIYLLDRCTNPAILIECGFLSNKDECAQLSESKYQKELSLAIFSGIISYIGDNVNITNNNLTRP